MSGFSFDSSGPPRPSFQRLLSTNINGPNSDRSSNAKPSGGGKIFNELSVEGPKKAGEEPQTNALISPLESTIQNLKETSDTITRIAGVRSEVEDINSESSKVKVRDVDNAAKLAEDLSQRIRGDEAQASRAQVDGLSFSKVQRILS